jgi:hypothetical protein
MEYPFPPPPVIINYKNEWEGAKPGYYFIPFDLKTAIEEFYNYSKQGYVVQLIFVSDDEVKNGIPDVVFMNGKRSRIACLTVKHSDFENFSKTIKANKKKRKRLSQRKRRS